MPGCRGRGCECAPGRLKVGTALAQRLCSPSPLQGKEEEAESGSGQRVGTLCLKEQFMLQPGWGALTDGRTSWREVGELSLVP